MTHRDELLNRVMAANPVPNEYKLPVDLAELRPPLAILIMEETTMDAPHPSPSLPMTDTGDELLSTERSRSMDTQQRPDVREPERRTGWRTAAIAFAAVILVVGAVAGIAAIVGDDGEDVVAPPETTTAVAPPEPTELRLTFHGEGCTYEGPTELQPGPVRLVYVNESDVWSGMNFTILDEGYTAQDVIDQLGPQPSKRPAPPWVTEMGTWEAVAAGGTLSWSFDLEPGIYNMVCARQVPRQGWEGWFGTGLTVEG